MASRAGLALKDATELLGVAADLSSKKRRFTELYVTTGQTGCECFLAVNPSLDGTDKKVREYATNAASAWLASPDVDRFRKELIETEMSLAGAVLKPWMELAGRAQKVLTDVMTGRCRSRLQLDASIHVLNRCFGLPEGKVEVDVSNQAKATQALKLFASRRTKVTTEVEEVVASVVSEVLQVGQGEEVPVEVSAVSEASGGE